ncbi:hypothetical protein CVT24_011111 [Panaeolus cyanescens]|uniref:L-tyrosine decarboxylase C-terminal domain-containing protein n=1 Tax=Panaeolus cyanescens TaxID=181874 RepID=A0A409YG67_9AGAR|nr:hypothetical protein CVT24_011111 [Panaeolus cyanescens]
MDKHPPQDSPHLPPVLHEAVSAWFLGPQAENATLLKDLFTHIVNGHAEARKSYHPEDGIFITKEIKESPTYKKAVEHLQREFTHLSDMLNENSIPIYSPRYAGHMSFESSLPSILGWLSAMLFNPNNVAFEASPITTLLELDVGFQICEMLGYPFTDSVKPWGHLTCDGTLTLDRAARNLKFYPLALREAMMEGKELSFLSESFRIRKCNTSEEYLFSELSTWELLNLRSKDILDIPDRLHEAFGISAKFLEDSLRPYIIQTTGKDIVERRWGIEHPMQYLITSTKHYSWPKGAALTGIGAANVVNVPVDEDARMDKAALRSFIEERYQKQQAIYAIVAIIGSTEEGAVDPLDEIVALKVEYEKKGMTFLIHADAAWGGYFASMIREGSHRQAPPQPTIPLNLRFPAHLYVPSLSLKNHTLKQIKLLSAADSVTVDPHKSGYCPYPAGGLCYKDGRLRYLLTWTAPYINQGQNGESIGVYGVEGSKPGAAAAAVYLHHSVVGLHKLGHGSLLGEVRFSCARISAHWATLSDATTPYVVVPLNKLLSEPDAEEVEKEKTFIRQKILGRSNKDIIEDADPMALDELLALGSDLNINTFACNFRLPDTEGNESNLNTDVEEANYLNKCIFDRLSVTGVDKRPQDIPIFITSTVFAHKDYGHCLDSFKKRLGLETDSSQDLFVLRNVVMSPFQAAADFTGKVTEIFRQTLEQEMKHVVARNMITPQEHMFVMQGTELIYLVYRPLFHKANGRQQLILKVQPSLDSENEWAAYMRAKSFFPEDTFTFFVETETLENILESGQLTGYIYHRLLGTNISRCTLVDVKIIKQRSLCSRWRDQDYPLSYCPFYLYGSPQEPHIDHMLLKAPNAQLAAENVQLNLDRTLSGEQMSNGSLLLYMDRHERAMQPFDDDNPPSFFKPGLEFSVKVYEDPFPPTSHGPGLAPIFCSETLDPEVRREAVATGTIRLGPSVWVDYTDLNKQDFQVDSHVGRYTEDSLSEGDRAEWRRMVSGRMGSEDDNNEIMPGWT